MIGQSGLHFLTNLATSQEQASEELRLPTDAANKDGAFEEALLIAEEAIGRQPPERIQVNATPRESTTVAVASELQVSLSADPEGSKAPSPSVQSVEVDGFVSAKVMGSDKDGDQSAPSSVSVVASESEAPRVRRQDKGQTIQPGPMAFTDLGPPEQTKGIAPAVAPESEPSHVWRQDRSQTVQATTMAFADSGLPDESNSVAPEAAPVVSNDESRRTPSDVADMASALQGATESRAEPLMLEAAPDSVAAAPSTVATAYPADLEKPTISKEEYSRPEAPVKRREPEVNASDLQGEPQVAIATAKQPDLSGREGQLEPPVPNPSVSAAPLHEAGRNPDVRYVIAEGSVPQTVARKPGQDHPPIPLEAGVLRSAASSRNAEAPPEPAAPQKTASPRNSGDIVQSPAPFQSLMTSTTDVAAPDEAKILIGDPIENRVAGASATSGPARADAPIAPPPASADPKVVTQQVTQALIRMDGARTEVTLDPVELGRVSLAFVTKDDGVSVSVTADRPETAELLRRNSEQLERDLANAGYEGVELDFAQSESDQSDRQKAENVEESKAPQSQPMRILSAHINAGLDIRI